ncbi:hypothetical protein GKG47_07595 [Lactonifactor sp. BIOML-A3]|nr:MULTISPECIES: hypothetical protein [unclassified Lactonifactor]MSB67474.1 hypothetical protein [Lactonifactor sp. BIOML-A7]MSA00226.1 hypothetical protein [Lactonifactor sp. BIOML-A5]MSA09465.1 hypothetical protein [Lactonifactor sp. BIOML-A4]MSA12311.1 hypothetical protein [Lactonifactor sp. BIOML-A3]MSA18513.1 hypothetical protein [Lactonifactor sp. BIOML-A2]
MEGKKGYLYDLEKLITVRLMQEDTETVYSLLKTERDPIFAMGILPYYAMFVQSCQEYMGEIFLEEVYAKKIKNTRNFLKAYGDGFGKSKKRVESIDENQNEQYRERLNFDFMKNWNIHMNLGTYWTEDKHIIGNTQMIADFLEVRDVFNTENKEIYRKLGEQIGSFVVSLKEGFPQSICLPEINRPNTGKEIKYFYDLNTNNVDKLFRNNSQKSLNLFFLNITCNLNFIKYVLRPLLDVDNKWLFRVEYIVTYYAYRSIQRLKNYCENNTDLCIGLEEFTDMLESGRGLFQSKFRNCMMHYGIENQGVISIEYIEKPFYGIVETCYNGKDYNYFLEELRNISEKILMVLEDRFDAEGITLEHL